MIFKNTFMLLLLNISIALFAAEVPENIKLATEQVLRIDLPFEPQNVHPHYSLSFYDNWVVNDLFEALVTQDAKGHSVPGAAVRWEANKTYTVWTFHLRPEACWSNGDPVTAEDFVHSQRTLLMSDSRKASCVDSYWTIQNAAAVKQGKLPLAALGIQATDVHTLQITLQAPDVFFPERCGQSIYPLHKESALPWPTGSDIAVPKVQVTNGAYCNLVYVTNLKYQAERNPHYWDNIHTIIDHVEYYFTKDITLRQERFMQGKMEFTELLTNASGLEAQYESKFGEAFHQIPSLSEISMILNAEQKPFNNVKVRQAFNMVIDREALLTYLKQPKHLPVYSELHPAVVSQPLIEPEWVSWIYEKRVAEARKKLAGLQLPPLVLICDTNIIKSKLPVYLAQVWKETLGADVKVIEMDSMEALQKVRNNAFSIRFRVATKVNPSLPLSFLGGFSQPAEKNYCHYHNARLVSLLEAGRSAVLTPADRLRALLQANYLLAEEGPLISLYYQTNDCLVQPHLGGIDSNNLIGRFKAKDLYLIDQSSI